MIVKSSSYCFLLNTSQLVCSISWNKTLNKILNMVLGFGMNSHIYAIIVKEKRVKFCVYQRLFVMLSHRISTFFMFTIISLYEIKHFIFEDEKEVILTSLLSIKLLLYISLELCQHMNLFFYACCFSLIQIFSMPPLFIFCISHSGQLVVASLLDRNIKSHLLIRKPEKATALFGEHSEDKLKVWYIFYKLMNHYCDDQLVSF